jgi:hypothetical protein
MRWSLAGAFMARLSLQYGAEGRRMLAQQRGAANIADAA